MDGTIIPNWCHTISGLQDDAGLNAFDWALQSDAQPIHERHLIDIEKIPSHHSSLSTTEAPPDIDILNKNTDIRIRGINNQDSMVYIDTSRVDLDQTQASMIGGNGWPSVPVMDPTAPRETIPGQIFNTWQPEPAHSHMERQLLHRSMSKPAPNKIERQKVHSRTTSRSFRTPHRNSAISRRNSRRRWSSSRSSNYGKQSTKVSNLLSASKFVPTQLQSYNRTQKNASLDHVDLFEENIPSLSSRVAQRKAADLLEQLRERQEEVVRIEEQLRQIFLDEQKYGSAEDSGSDLNLSMLSSSQYSTCSSDLVHSQNLSDDTSVSSTPRQASQLEQSSDVGIRHRCTFKHCRYKDCSSCDSKSTFYCTLDGCCYSSHSFADWKRHERGDTHYPQERFMCWECLNAPPLINMNGEPICQFCFVPFSELGGDARLHFLQCDCARKSVANFPRRDRLTEHLRVKHDLRNSNKTSIDNWKFPIESEWPRECPFCETKFQTWDERMEHIAGHYRKRPSAPPKDFPPRDPGNDNDDDEDNDFGGGGNGKGVTPTMGLSNYPTHQSTGQQNQSVTQFRYSNSNIHYNYTGKSCTSNLQVCNDKAQQLQLDTEHPLPSQLLSQHQWVFQSLSISSESLTYHTAIITKDRNHQIGLMLQRYLTDPEEAVTSWPFPTWVLELLFNGVRTAGSSLPSSPAEEALKILGESLLKITLLGGSSRQDIEVQAKNWLGDLQATCNLAFMRYIENLPRLQGYGIVQDMIKIASLRKSLTSSRPTDFQPACESRGDKLVIHCINASGKGKSGRFYGVTSKNKSLNAITRVVCTYTSCQTTFANTKAMRKHQEEYHKPPKQCPYDCVPAYRTKRRNRLAQHLIKVHGMEKAEASVLGRQIEDATPYDADVPQQDGTQGQPSSLNASDQITPNGYHQYDDNQGTNSSSSETEYQKPSMTSLNGAPGWQQHLDPLLWESRNGQNPNDTHN